MSLSILVVDDDESIRGTLVDFFETFGYTARSAASATAGRQLAAEHAPDVVLLDLRLPDADGLRALEALKADDPDLAVVVLTGHADVATAVSAMKAGAVDLLEKPVDLELLDRAIQRAAQPARLRQEVAALRQYGSAPNDKQLTLPSVAELIALAAKNSEATVLLQGETGTGKGFVARQIHDQSDRAGRPFIEVNCASLTSTFLESELFGHERGAFTDARTAKRGLLEVAGSGTIFLDEIAELSADVQPRLLKVLEERTFRRMGGTTLLRTDARIIVATHRDLAAAVAERQFRADLYYRLQVLTIHLPPLRARPQDIPMLADALLPKGAELSADARTALQQYEWPGNIRELRNTLWRASILAEGRPIQPGQLGITTSSPTTSPDEPLTLEAAERLAISRALHAANGNRTRAAELLGIARSTLQEKLKRQQV